MLYHRGSSHLRRFVRFGLKSLGLKSKRTGHKSFALNRRAVKHLTALRVFKFSGFPPHLTYLV